MHVLTTALSPPHRWAAQQHDPARRAGGRRLVWRGTGSSSRSPTSLGKRIGAPGFPSRPRCYRWERPHTPREPVGASARLCVTQDSTIPVPDRHARHLRGKDPMRPEKPSEHPPAFASRKVRRSLPSRPAREAYAWERPHTPREGVGASAHHCVTQGSTVSAITTGTQGICAK